MHSAEPAAPTVSSPTESYIPLIALLTVFLVLIIDGGTSPYTLLTSTAILILATLACWHRLIPAAKAGAFMALFLLFAFITVVPLPDTILRPAGRASDSHHELSNKTLSESFNAEIISKGTRFHQFSRNRAGTMRGILLVSIALLSASLARQLPQRSRSYLLLTFGVLAALTGMVGLISLFIIPQHKTFWWLLPVLHGRPVAGFINANHFASFMAMSAVLMFGLACRKVFQLFWISNILVPSLFALLTIVVLASSSTGACLALGVGIFSASLINLRKRPVFVSAILLILAAGILSAPLLAGKNASLKATLKPLTELSSNLSVKLRLDTWKDAMPIIKSYPVFGTGLNGFRAVFPQHRTSATRKEHNNVENEYIQIPVESGITGTLILLTALFFFIRALCSRSVPNQNLLPVIIPALLVAASHCFVDFPVRIPVYLLICAVLLGLCTPENERLPGGRLQKLPHVIVIGIAGLILILSLFAPHKTFSLDSPDYLNTANPDKLAEAIASSPSYWHAYYSLGRQSAQNPDLRELAERQITAASRLNPLNYTLLTRLALLRLDMGKHTEAAQAYSQAKALRSWLHVSALEPLLKQD